MGGGWPLDKRRRILSLCINLYVFNYMALFELTASALDSALRFRPLSRLKLVSAYAKHARYVLSKQLPQGQASLCRIMSRSRGFEKGL